MNILFCIDKNYLMPLCVTLASIYENNKETHITTHVIGKGLEDSHKAIAKDLSNKYHQEIFFYSIDKTLLETMPTVHGYLTNAAYIRLFVSNILPNNINKILYLDSDIIINDRMDDIWNTNIEGYACAVVKDSYTYNISHFNRLQYPMSKGYFNSGVMLINLKYWREHKVMEQAVSFAENHKERICFEDQDILNYLFQDSKIHLPLKFNSICTYFFKKKPVPFELWDELKEAQEHPVIIHFTWIKPWFYEGLDHPYAKEFFKYQSLTKWNGMPLRYYYKGWAKYKFIINTFLRKIGLKKKYSPYIDLQL